MGAASCKQCTHRMSVVSIMHIAGAPRDDVTHARVVYQVQLSQHHICRLLAHLR
jgi:hypothetical protein